MSFKSEPWVGQMNSAFTAPSQQCQDFPFYSLSHPFMVTNKPTWTISSSAAESEVVFRNHGAQKFFKQKSTPVHGKATVKVLMTHKVSKNWVRESWAHSFSQNGQHGAHCTL